MSDLEHVQRCAEDYARERDHLTALVQGLQADMAKLQRRSLPNIRRRVGRVAEVRDRLRQAIEAAKAVFAKKPRTQVFSGIRCGYTKQKGEVVIDDEEATIARIYASVPKAQAELLVRVKRSVHKPAVYDLTASDLRRLGIRIEKDGDAIVIKPTDTAVDKIVTALLKDAEKIDDEAA
jgi:tryptophan 2,3-dioxygenase